MRTICIDFDGVIHSYVTGWHGVDVIIDDPVDGAIEWLRRVISEPDISACIYSSRSKEKKGIDAMQIWLLKNGLSEYELDGLSFPTQKPPAFLTIDDRAICFKGKFPTVKQMIGFKPWNKK